jgi:hypothetical protein
MAEWEVFTLNAYSMYGRDEKMLSKFKFRWLKRGEHSEVNFQVNFK